MLFDENSFETTKLYIRKKPNHLKRKNTAYRKHSYVDWFLLRGGNELYGGLKQKLALVYGKI